jgi:hypothetical protein
LLAAAVIAVTLHPGPVQAATIPYSTACPPPGTPVVNTLTATSSVDVRTKSGRITFTATATDAVPITRMIVGVASPYQSSRIKLQASFTLTGGTATNGTWTASLVIPRFSQDGIWKISSLTAVDQGGGYPGEGDYGTDGSNGENWGDGWPRTFKVTSKNDLSPPTVTSMRLSHASVDTASKAETIVATVHAQDNLAGIKQITVSGVLNVHGHTYLTRGGVVTFKTPIVASHTYTIPFVVPKAVGYGTHTWSLSLAAIDGVGNELGLARAQLLAHHLTSTFKVVSRTDFTPPVLTGLSFSSTSIDARTAPQQVTVTVKATDAVSGVGSAFLSLNPAVGIQVQVLPTGKAGNTVTWKGTFTVPQCGLTGTWTVLGVSLVDATSAPDTAGGNGSNYSTQALAAGGYPTTLNVQQLDVVPPTASVPKTVSHTGPVVVTFSEPTLWKGSGNPFTVYDVEPGLHPAGTWTCKNGSSVTVGCNDDGADVVTASFQPTADLTVGHVYDLFTSSPPDPASGVYDTSGNGPLALDAQFTAS